MPKVDMSAHAVTTRLKRVAQLRRLGLSLQRAKIKPDGNRIEARTQRNEESAKRNQGGKE